MTIEHRYPLLSHTTMAIDAVAEWWIEYASKEELQQLSRDEFFATLPFMCIGSGSNILFLENYPGALLHSSISDYSVVKEDPDGSVTIRVGSGVVWDDLVLRALEDGYFGLENLSHIPGTVGASAVQNIGAYGSEAAHFIQCVEVIDIRTGEESVLPAEACQYAYRFSCFKTPEYRNKVITHVHYRLSRTPKANVSYRALQDALGNVASPSPMQIREAVVKVRDSKLPRPEQHPNAGSFFMNPIVDRSLFEHLQKEHPDIPNYTTEKTDQIKLSAAWLIDRSGLKGFSQGKVSTHIYQPLVLVQSGGASGREVADFALFVSQEVFRKMGVRLHPEVLFVPNDLYDFSEGK